MYRHRPWWTWDKAVRAPSVGAAHMMCHDTHLDSTRWLRGCGCDPSPSPRRGRALQPILLDLLCFAFDRDNHRRITFHTSRGMQGQEVQVQQSHSRARSGFPTNPVQISVRGTPFLFLSGVPRKWISQTPGSTSHRNCPATRATKPPFSWTQIPFAQIHFSLIGGNPKISGVPQFLVRT